MSTPAAPAPDDAALYEHSASGLLLTRENGDICRANATFCRWTGYQAEELVGHRRLQDLLTAGARIFFQTHWAPLLQMQGSVAEVKIDVKHRDGHTLPMLINAVRHKNAGGTFHALAMLVVEDRHKYERELVLARRRADELLGKEQAARQAFVQAEGKLRLALKSADLYVWEYDAASGERHFEDPVALLLGRSEPGPVSHAEWTQAIDMADREREAQAFSRITQADAPDSYCVYRVHGDDGVTRVISSSGRGVGNFFVGILQDVSDVVNMRAAAEDRALFAEQMIGIVSHDLRNPLAAIKMSAVVLERSEISERHREILARIQGATNRARRLVSDLLDFTLARVGSGLAVKPRPIDLRNVIAGAVTELAVVFPERTLSHDHQGPARCSADADRLVQVVGNLVANAMAYGAKDAPVSVVSRVDDQGASISVHNEGPAIDRDLQRRMFDAMARGQSLENAQRSVGLGLYIVRQIALAHGGDVDVVSTAEAGTTFTLRLPHAPLQPPSGCDVGSAESA